jgi:hypothetical protein
MVDRVCHIQKQLLGPVPGLGQFCGQVVCSGVTACGVGVAAIDASLPQRPAVLSVLWFFRPVLWL